MRQKIHIHQVITDVRSSVRIIMFNVSQKMLAYKKDFVSNKILQPGGENKENKKFYLWAFRFYQTSDIKT